MSHASGAERYGAADTATQTGTVRDTPSTGELLAHVSEDLSTLVRQEIALAKAEATQSAKQAGTGAGLLAGAGVGGHFVLLFLSIAAMWGLGDLIGWGWASLVIAVVWAIIAAVLAAVGRSKLKQAPGLPQTTESLKQAPNALKGHEELNR